MASNIEVKAHSKEFANQQKLAAEIAGKPPQLLLQEDVFFRSAQGRLKLRIMGPEKGELIAYSRPNKASPKLSIYEIFRTNDPERLRATLSSAMPIEGIIRKRRFLYLWGQTRIHLDEVEELGQFIELEVVLREDQPAAEGHRIAQNLMKRLGICEQDLIDVAYLDLLKGVAAI